jgi:hypothetical protein
MTDNPLKPTELLPCPWCDRPPKICMVDERNRNWYKCPNGHTDEMVAEVWNTRSRPAVGEEEIEKWYNENWPRLAKDSVPVLNILKQAISKLINKGEK